MNGYPVGEVRILETSPSVKHRVTAMIRPKNQLKYTDHMMAFGKVAEASLISSAVASISFSVRSINAKHWSHLPI